MVTFNVLHGMSVADGRVDGDRFAAAMRALDADVLGLQEVDLAQPRSGHLDLTALAAEALGAGAYRFTAAVDGTPGELFTAATGGGDPTGGDASGGPRFGVALVSRLPVRSWHVTRLAAAPVRSPVYAPGPQGRFLLLRDEPRVVLAAVVEGPAGPVTVATTHLSFVPGWNVAQLRRVVRALRRLPAPRVLLGDLNMPAWAAGLASGWGALARCPTYPAGRPSVQLDHVLTDAPGRWRVAAVGTPESPVSDHRPLAVDVDWPAVSEG
jgi:endonuclease/exonuclease/phosphatase family metal-dependent hydrolase